MEGMDSYEQDPIERSSASKKLESKIITLVLFSSADSQPFQHLSSAIFYASQFFHSQVIAPTRLCYLLKAYITFF